MMLLLLSAAMMLRDDQFQSQLGDLADIKGHKHTEKRNLHTRAHTQTAYRGNGRQLFWIQRAAALAALQKSLPPSFLIKG